MRTIEEVISKLEYCGISVYNYEENNILCGYELSDFTDAGVNMSVFIDFRDTEKDPKNADHFIELFNERVDDIDIEEELQIHLQYDSYKTQIGATRGVKDFTDWKESLLSIFSKKTPLQRQYEQVVDKLRSQLEAMEQTLELMPKKGGIPATCQRTNISNYLGGIDHCINGIELEDFIPNEYSGDFELSYS